MSEKDVKEFTGWLEEMPDSAEPETPEPHQAEQDTITPPNLPEIKIVNLEVAAQNLLQLKVHIEELCAEAYKFIIIKDEETAKAATIIGKQLKDEGSALEKMRKHFIEPLLLAQRTVNSWFGSYTDPTERALKWIRNLLSGYRVWQETERRRLQAEQEAAAKKLQAEQEARAEEARKQGILYEPAEPPAVVTPPVTKVIHAGGASASQRRDFKVVVDDEKLIPDEYWIRQLNMKKLEEDLKAGIAVTGARLVEDFITHIR